MTTVNRLGVCPPAVIFEIATEDIVTLKPDPKPSDFRASSKLNSQRLQSKSSRRFLR